MDKPPQLLVVGLSKLNSKVYIYIYTLLADHPWRENPTLFVFRDLEAEQLLSWRDSRAQIFAEGWLMLCVMEQQWRLFHKVLRTPQSLRLEVLLSPLLGVHGVQDGLPLGRVALPQLLDLPLHHGVQGSEAHLQLLKVQVLQLL